MLHTALFSATGVADGRVHHSTKTQVPSKAHSAFAISLAKYVRRCHIRTGCDVAALPWCCNSTVA